MDSNDKTALEAVAKKRAKFFDLFCRMVYVIDRMHALLPGNYGNGDLSRQMTTFEEVRNIWREINELIYPDHLPEHYPVEVGKGMAAAQWVVRFLYDGDPTGLMGPALDPVYSELRDRITQLEVQLSGCGVAAKFPHDFKSRAQPGDYGWSSSYQDVCDLADAHNHLEGFLEVSKNQKPVGWERVFNEGIESLQPMYVKGDRMPKYPASYAPRYALVTAEGTFAATVRQCLSQVVDLADLTKDMDHTCEDWLAANASVLPYSGPAAILKAGFTLAIEQVREQIKVSANLK